jgi:hypothetical protein
LAGEPLQQAEKHVRCPVTGAVIPPYVFENALLMNHLGFTQSQYGRQAGNQPHFPFTADHLLPLIQYNLMRAMLTNMKIVAYDRFVSFGGDNFWTGLASIVTPNEMPQWLIPTPLQQSLTHELWIDLLPHPRLRDNIIMSMGKIDLESLKRDLVGACVDELIPGQGNPQQTTGMLVWSDPWRPDAWEVTAYFTQKWAFLLKDCPELILSTNQWRASRGEGPLVV